MAYGVRAVLGHLNRNTSKDEQKQYYVSCMFEHVFMQTAATDKNGRKLTYPDETINSDGAFWGVLSLKQMRMWGRAANAMEAKHRPDVDCWIRAVTGSRSVTALYVWARPTCVLTTGLAVAQDAAAGGISSTIDTSQVTLLWVTCSTKGNTCRPAGQHHMLGTTRTLHEALNTTRLSPVSWHPMIILASARYIFLRWEHWKYN